MGKAIQIDRTADIAYEVQVCGECQRDVRELNENGFCSAACENRWCEKESAHYFEKVKER